MKIIVTVKPNSKKNTVEKTDEGNFLIHVSSPPRDGKSNAAVIKLLSDYFDVAPSLVEVISGHMARVKVVMVHE
jgi:uncharacterized protein